MMHKEGERSKLGIGKALQRAAPPQLFLNALFEDRTSFFTHKTKHTTV